MALNIQRARDHGLPDYNTIREAYGLSRKTSWEDINIFNISHADYPDGSYMKEVLLDFSLTVKAATLIFISGCGSAIPSAMDYNTIREAYGLSRRTSWEDINIYNISHADYPDGSYMKEVLLDFSLTVKAATLIFISGCGSAIPSAMEGKSGLFIIW